MKKIYKNPTLEVVKIQTSQQMLTGSVQMFGKDATGSGMSREFEFFGDGEY